MTALLPFLFLICTIVFGVLWGERTSKPLWLAAFIPSFLATTGVLVPILLNTPPQRWTEALGIIGGFIPAIWVLYGGLGYFSAKRNRRSSN
ncbi:hypothetical protein KTQ42_20045 [Noviherbaspirillum sp. L7-7A]|uniref:hypothetical protein n=1 Tax=Noviherbaspirillum sp. L7-7A TaxID=2850560 RepID=UPI001C2BF0CD|nr:hypothetical protein [Noviherbaspirillum sp. L7-7A]MBV0881576.1 hypothetical protein [Noviherbaspirillum sp. L7-7A]